MINLGKFFNVVSLKFTGNFSFDLPQRREEGKREGGRARERRREGERDCGKKGYRERERVVGRDIVRERDRGKESE